MERDLCYIDKELCTSGRFSFCDECRKAQTENEDEIRRAKTPLEVTRAHIPFKREKE